MHLHSKNMHKLSILQSERLAQRLHACIKNIDQPSGISLFRCVPAGMRGSMSRSSSRSGRPDSVQSLKPPVPRAGTAAGNVRPARQRSCSVGRRRVTS